MGHIINDGGSWNCLCGLSSNETAHCGGCGRSKASALDQLKREKESARPVEMTEDERLALEIYRAAFYANPREWGNMPEPDRRAAINLLAKARDLLGVDKLKAALADAQEKLDFANAEIERTCERMAEAAEEHERSLAAATKRAEEAEARMGILDEAISAVRVHARNHLSAGCNVPWVERRLKDAQLAPVKPAPSAPAEARIRVAPRVCEMDDDELARKISRHVTNGNDDWNSLSPMQRTRFRDAAKEVRLLIQSAAPAECKPSFPIGFHVTKVSGDTHPSGTVRGTFVTLAGKERVVVELDAYHGMLYIFSPEQLQVSETSPVADQKTDERPIGSAMAAVESLAQAEVERHSRACSATEVRNFDGETEIHSNDGPVWSASAQNEEPEKCPDGPCASCDRNFMECKCESDEAHEPTRYPTPALDAWFASDDTSYTGRVIAVQSDIAAAVKRAQDSYEDACDRKDKRIAELESKLGETSSTWTAKAEKDLADLSAIIDPEMEHMGPLAEVLRKKLADLEAQVTELGFLQTRKDYDDTIAQLKERVGNLEYDARAWDCLRGVTPDFGLTVAETILRRLRKLEEFDEVQPAPAFVPSAETVERMRLAVEGDYSTLESHAAEVRLACMSLFRDLLAAQAAGKVGK